VRRPPPANVFQLEIAAAFADRRRLAARIGLAFLLGLPFALIEMPPWAAAAGVTMLVIFVAFFGAAVARERRRREGRLERLRLLPLRPAVVLLDFASAGAAVDLMQLVPVVALFVAVRGEGLTASAAGELAGLLFSAVLVLNFLGTLLAGLVRSNPEVHLAGAIAVGVLAFLGGVLPCPERTAFVPEAWARVSLLARLYSGLSGAASSGPATTTAGAVAALAGLCTVCAVFLARAHGRRPRRSWPADLSDSR
jgi:hypothetical protein